MTKSIDHEKLVDDLFEAHPNQAESLANHRALIGFFVGQAMRKTKGQCEPEKVRAILTRRWEEARESN